MTNTKNAKKTRQDAGPKRARESAELRPAQRDLFEQEVACPPGAHDNGQHSDSQSVVNSTCKMATDNRRETQDNAPMQQPPSPSRFRPLTLADVRGAVLASKRVSNQRAQDCCRAVDQLASMLGQPAETIAADPLALRNRMASIDHRHVALTAREWRHLCKLLDSALQLAGLQARPRKRSKAPLSDTWEDLLANVRNRYDRCFLRQFAAFCDRQNRDPESVDPELFHSFGSHLIASKVDRPKQAHREVAKAWNKSRGAIAGWPEAELPVPKTLRYRALTLDEMPASFRQELEGLLDTLAEPDLLDESDTEEMSRFSVRNRRAQLLQAATALVEAGTPVHSIRGLEDLAQPTAARAILRRLRERHGVKKSGQMANIAAALRLVARRRNRPEAELEQLRRMAGKVRPRGSGMTETNKRRLRQFKDTANMARLVAVPRDLMAEARLRPPNAVDATRMERALAIGILLVAPMREKNLASLRLDRHLSWSRSGRQGAVHIVLPAHEVKNDKDLEFPLPGWLIELLDLYMARYRPLLTEVETPCLFPGAGRDGLGQNRRPILDWQSKLPWQKRSGLR
ncbi:hypothetical protein GCM10007036_21430 [Alsobacter metallidurans]|uniref:Tyr recombinase domain-containing protein n=2 Tax=Alsobacter metallidurans TaxID=340221 RepID=A0A917I797_9HYPH|nr:hypothetical protein GCM10007036_21430 [Alsobacter metallidurans]